MFFGSILICQMRSRIIGYFTCPGRAVIMCLSLSVMISSRIMNSLYKAARPKSVNEWFGLNALKAGIQC